MSAECCGPEEGETRQKLTLTPSARAPLATPPGMADEQHADDDVCCSPSAPRVNEHGEPEEARPWFRDPSLLLPIASGVFLLAGYITEWTVGGIAATIVLAVGLVAGAYTFVPGAIRRLLKGRLGVGLLMTIAAIGAVALGRVGEAAALAFLFSIAEALEDRAMDRARDGLRALLSLIPETATLSKLSGEVVVPAAEVREFDILVVKPGERVATDGVVVDGRSSVDASAITGESIPVEVGPGDTVPAGAINGNGPLQLEATAAGRDNSLTKIVELVEQANARKGERARLADRIAKPLVPAVLILAGLVLLFGFVVGEPALWAERALVVLVAASPCALAIAVPVTVISAIGSASRFGVIIKSGDAFERLGTIRTIAFDKTGTLTKGRPEVAAVETADGVDRELVLGVAAGLERQSTHPLAAAIAAAAGTASTVTDVQELPGRGITGSHEGRAARIGSPRWVDPAGLSARTAELEREGMTVAVLELDGTAVGLIGIRDELRPEAAEAVRALHAAGISTAMLTGDNERTAAAIAAQVGITDVRAQLMPADKVTAVESLGRTSPTAMIGDGVNDAPALAAAEVGIAMGVTGSDAAIESASVAFTGSDLRLLPDALAHAKRGRAIMVGNIGLSLALIVVLMPLALFGVLGLATVVLVHEIAEVIVILNGIRAARRKRTALTVAAPTRTPVTV